MVTVLHSERSSRRHSEPDAFHINDAITAPAASEYDMIAMSSGGQTVVH